MSNLWEFANEYRVIDVEGVILDNPNDYILIREVSGMDETTITLSREGNSHGFDYEFSDAEKPFGFSKAMKIEGQIYDPYTLLLGIYAAKGVDGKATLELHNLNETPELQYQAELDFESLERIDYKLNLNARRINLSDLFRTRYDIPVNFGATESIDGVAVTGLTPQSMFLHSSVITNNSSTTIPPIEFLGFNIISITRRQVTPPICETTLFNVGSIIRKVQDGITYENGDKAFIEQVSPDTFETNSLLYWPPPFTTCRFINYYILNVQKNNYNASVDVYIDGSFFSEQVVADIELNLVAKTGATIEKFLLYADTTPINVTKVFTVDETFIIPKSNIDETFTELYIEYTLPELPCSVTDTSQFLYINDNGFRFDMTIDFIKDNSQADVYNPFDAFNHVLEMTTNGTNLLTSNFLQNLANDIYLTNGYKIRQYPNRNLIPSFKDMFDDWAQPMFGLGFAIYNDAGTFKVLLERYEEFYKDVEIDYIDTVQDDTFRISIDKDIIFNEINTGFKEYPKSTDENKNNNLDEFNTEHKHLSPIQTVKKKVEYISKIIASGFIIENQRREQFKDVPNDTVSYDEKIFCIKGISSDTYTGVVAASTGSPVDIILQGTYYNINVGEEITIREGLNIKTFIIASLQTIGTETIVTPDSSQGVFSFTNAIIDLPSSKLRAERNDNIDVLNNVISPDTVYNVGLNPKSFLFNQSPILNSGFNLKPDTAEVKTQKVFLNGEMEFSFKPGEGEYVLMPDDQTVKMDSDIALSALNGNNKLFSGLLINFTCNLTYDRVLKIRDACLNQSLLGDNYGYIRVKDFEGQDWKGWIMSMTYNPLSQQTEFILKGQFIPSGSSFDYVIESELN